MTSIAEDTRIKKEMKRMDALARSIFIEEELAFDSTKEKFSQIRSIFPNMWKYSLKMMVFITKEENLLSVLFLTISWL